MYHVVFRVPVRGCQVVSRVKSCVLCVCVCVLVRERERDLIINQKLIKHLQVLEKREKGKDCRAVLSSVSPPSDPEAGAGLAFATVRQADGALN